MKNMLSKTNLKRVMGPNYGSMVISDRATIETFIRGPHNSFLVSFPRTGSHWLRMLMELYFGQPSLVRVFYYPERKDYLTLHTHDLELDEEYSSVIYLYRDAVDTIYSQLRYHQEDINSHERIAYWSDLYGRHLDKWLGIKKNLQSLKLLLNTNDLKLLLMKSFKKYATILTGPFKENDWNQQLPKYLKNM